MRFVAALVHGGFRKTHHLLTSSPAQTAAHCHVATMQCGIATAALLPLFLLLLQQIISERDRHRRRNPGVPVVRRMKGTADNSGADAAIRWEIGEHSGVTTNAAACDELMSAATLN
jgi:hypothetical protein